MTDNDRAKGARSRMRPEWNSSHVQDNIEQWASLGLTDEQIAHHLGLCRQTLSEKKWDIPDIADAIKRGRSAGITEVADLLRQKAITGDTGAMIFYLKAKGGWSDRTTEQEVIYVKSQLAIFYDLCKAILEYPSSDSNDVGQIKSMVGVYLDHLLIKAGKAPTPETEESL